MAAEGAVLLGLFSICGARNTQRRSPAAGGNAGAGGWMRRRHRIVGFPPAPFPAKSLWTSLCFPCPTSEFFCSRKRRRRRERQQNKFRFLCG